MSDLRQQTDSGYALLNARNIEGATRVFRSVLAEDAENWDALEGLVHCALPERRDEALELISRLRHLRPDDPYPDFLEAQAWLESDKASDRKKAIALCETACERMPRFAAAHQLMGRIYARHERRDAAETAYRQALNLAPNNAQLLADLSFLLQQMGRHREADQLSLRAVEQNPNSATALVARGETALLKGDLREAEELALSALQRDANHGGAITLLVSVKARRNPVMGIWWRWAIFMDRLGSGWARWGVVIGIWALWQVFRRTALADAPAWVQWTGLGLYFAFCLLTWFGPMIFNRMVRAELRKVQIKPGF